MFRGREQKAAIAQRLQAADWASPEERSEIIAAALEVGPKLPIKLLFQFLRESLANPQQPRAKERVQCIADIINGLSAEIVAPYFAELLECFTLDRQQILFPAIADRVITQNGEQLITVLRTGAENLRKMAFQLVVQKGKGVIYRDLETSLRKDAWDSKRIGLFALKEIGGTRAIPVIIEFMHSGQLQDKLYAIELLADVDNLAVIQAMAKAAKETTNVDVKLKAAWAFGQSNSPRAIQPLIEMTAEDENWKVRVQAIRSLGLIRDEHVIKPLMDLLNHADHRIRREVVNVIAKNGNIAVLPCLVEKLKDINNGVREGALEALGHLGLEGRIDKYKVIIAVMQHDSPYIRSRLKDVMKIFDDTDLMERLVLSLRNEDWWVRERIARTLLELKEFNLVEPITQLLKDENEITRRFAVEILEKLEDPKALEALISTLNDEDWWVKERAVEALANTGDRRCLPALIPLLKDPNLRYQVTRALGKFKEPQTVKHLDWVLRKGHKEVKLEAIRALEAIATGEVIEPITSMLNDENILVRLEASTALKRLQARLSTTGAMSVGNIELADEKVVPLLEGLLLTSKKQGATDLYLLAESQPYMRKGGEAQVVYPMHLSGAETKKLLLDIMNDDQKEILEKDMELDFSYVIEGKGRFRVNVFNKSTGLSGVFRIIPDVVPTLDELKVPDICKAFGDMHQGLVLITGAACQGKSTTMAGLMDYINKRHKLNMISIEEPIEYIHTNLLAQITQREVGVHTHSYPNALRSALREDPDVICIGEMRDLESISIAITAAETGHLVMATLHAFSASKTIDRMIGVFPNAQQSQIRLMMAENLKGVINQQLVRTRDGGRRAAFEVMLGTPSVRNLIRERKTEQLNSIMTASSDEGMITMDNSILKFLMDGEIDEEEAFYRAHHRGDFEKMVEMQKETYKESAKQRYMERMRTTPKGAMTSGTN